MILNRLGAMGLAAAFVTTIAACGSSSSYQSEPTPQYGQSTGQGQQYSQGQQQYNQGQQFQPGQGQAGICPTQVPGTSVQPQDIDGGEALAFTTNGDVNAVRQRVHQLAQQIGQQGSLGGGMQGGTMGGQGMLVAPGSATAEDISMGALLILKPSDPSQLGQLREQVRMQAEQLSRGDCSSIQGQLPGQQLEGNPQAPSESPSQGTMPEPTPSPAPVPEPNPTPPE